MIRLYDFDEVKPEEILNRDIRAEADVPPCWITPPSLTTPS